MRRTPWLAILVVAGMIAGLVSPVLAANKNSVERLAGGLGPILSCLTGQREQFAVTSRLEIPIDGRPHQINATLVRHDDRSFELDIKHAEYWVQIRRTADATAVALPYHKVVFLGRGEVDAADQLAPAGITQRLLSTGSIVTTYATLLQASDAMTAALTLTTLAGVQYDEQQAKWLAPKAVSFDINEQGTKIDLKADSSRVQVELLDAIPAPAGIDAWPGLKVVEIERRELERQLTRGARRALEIVAPSPLLTSPTARAKKVKHGELRWVDGHRVALLRGTPEQIGRAHGELLAVEARRCIDSVLYAFGTVQTVRTGRWFRHDLESAYARLSPHIPPAHQREAQALAESMDLDPRLVQTVNVFPELFHCSGFAVFGTATKDGKLYHGRVLDYMTTIGLQDCATTFIVSVDGKIPFANVGYAGFIGSVSGMNAKAISLGEMGGRGEGKWDGAPMATLMRRALEECSSLEQVQRLWTTSPRTCEYYYVFADGKTHQAVGVAATPESIEFVLPGQSHELLGPGIPDSVVLSAGSRLEKLRQRVQENHGKIDADIAQSLMCRPVAMQSNLHNVLFVPEDGVLYVANADHKRPAADRPYVRLDLHELLRDVSLSSGPGTTGSPGR